MSDKADSPLTLVIGNKNYSSWSLRAWLVLRHAGLQAEEILIALNEPGFKSEILKYSPSGRVPCLVHGNVKIWDSLAIGEYAADLAPEAGLWPDDRGARALARAVSAEMHSGFAALREHMPMNIRSSFPKEGRKPGVQEDIDRVKAIWRLCRTRHGGDGPFLFGRFTIADAMYAPVVSRFRTFAVDLGDDERAYADAVWGLDAMKEWVEASENEPMVIDDAEF
ncbi:MAG: glutathione S-transferase family protein [Thalassobaculaceae bacterium]|nr:glutathione S-transferase family protein [Thalassobaculaceae bacterium]